MEKIQINLLSCRTREMNTDLLPVYRAARDSQDYLFHFFTRNAEAPEPTMKKNYVFLPDENVSSQVYLCNDISLRKYLGERTAHCKQILLVTPNNYYFRTALSRKDDNSSQEEKKELLHFMESFSHILVPNPLIREIILEHFKLDPLQKLILMQTPFSWRLRCPEKQTAARQAFLRRYPQAKNKKILLCILPAQMTEDKPKIAEGFSLETCLKQLGSEWMFVTNSPWILMQSVSLPLRYENSFLYLKNQYSVEDILYFCDLLISNLSFFVYGQLSRNMPFFCPEFADNPFEIYIKTCYPSLYLESLNDLSCLENRLAKASADHRVFYKKMVYLQKKDPVKKILALIKQGS